MDIFISYSRIDRERVDHIAKALEAEGYSVWWDRDIRAGEEFDHVIDKAIKQAKAIVVVWSKDSIRSNWVKEEAEDGVEENKLVPALIDQIVIPRGFRRIQAAELQDGGDNPTTSINWPEFLDSVKKIAGRGELGTAGAKPAGAAAPAVDHAVAQTLQRAATQAPSPTPSPAPGPVAARAGESAPAWKRFVPIGAGVLALLVAGFFAMQYFGGPRTPPPPEDMTPVVLGIYPSDSFGVDQADGLKAAFSDTPGVLIRDLAAPLDDMKGRDAPDLIAGLRNNLEKSNVIAIVGPSITEFTPEVLRVVEESGRRPAIVLTTAASRQDIGWDRSELPLFRVGSGVDERANQFARLAQNTVASGVELVLMYESIPNSTETTYGQLFFKRITERLPQWQQWSDSNKVRAISYTRGAIMDKASLPRVRPIFDQNKMIIVVGLSSDYRELAQNLYRVSDGPRAAILGGWNTSKAVMELNEAEPLQNDRLFDMTDVFRSPADTRGLPDSVRFQQEFGTLTPALRQEAVAYDSGLVVKQAVSEMMQNGAAITADNLVAILRGQSFNGITGEIAFSGDGPNWGQNNGQAGGLRPLYNLRYDPRGGSWSEIESFDAMLRASSASARGSGGSSAGRH